ncbi:hypothetical protein VSVS12_02733 [Vibrio scophthalmi]|uniref:hypothetical protein n=1 Tax=Vibrio scophthalmi TaxID=45658 RepID=UPI0008098A3F|nr:hypothetical protein [Vibrio scophthalmi]ANS86482.1 hypothetical protein VSVS12_02733 [Vibrio scophthalmi]
MEHIKTIIQFFKNDKENSLINIFYASILVALFLIPSKSYAYSNSDPILVAKYSEDKIFLSWVDYQYDFYSGRYNDFDPAKFNPFSHIDNEAPNFLIQLYYSGSLKRIYHSRYLTFHPDYTIKTCFDAGKKIIQVPSGLLNEGHYICSSWFGNIDGSENPNPDPDPDPDGILTPIAFDEFFCGRKEIKDKLTYAYYPFEQAIDYSVRRALSAEQVTGSDALNIYLCPMTDSNPDGICTHDYMVEQARKYLSSVPAERVHCFTNDQGGCTTFEVFAYCKSAIKQISTSDITPDAVDCRKTIYQFTGESGSELSPLPEKYCYEDNNQDHTFKEWCELQFDDSSYWVGANLEEYCDPAGKDTSQEQVEEDGKCEITTESIDVGYTTTETSNQIIKDITKKIIVKDCDGNIISEKIIESQIIVDKEEILGDGSNTEQKPCVVGAYCPPNSGTNEGTGSGVGENEAGSGSGNGSGNGSGTGTDWGDVGEVGDLTGWYVSKYPDGFQGVLNKHITAYNNGPLGQFIASLNPFGDGGSFPKFVIDVKVGDIVDFGKHTIDLEKIPMGENRTINIIALIKSLLLIYASIYAFRQVF